MGLNRIIEKLTDKKINFSVNFDKTRLDIVTITVYLRDEIIFCSFEDGEVAWYAETEYIKILNILVKGGQK